MQSVRMVDVGVGSGICYCLNKDREMDTIPIGYIIKEPIKNFYVHRLVLMSFKPIKNMRHFQVCHIDESRDNNRLENLQWGTARYNCNQRMHLKRLRNSHRGHTVSLETRRAISRGNRGRKVYQCDLEGVVLKKWDYISLAARTLGISPSNISKCCRGLCESAGGFKWKYVMRGE